MKKSFVKRLIIFLLVIVLFSLVYIPLLNDMKFGLDLKGGFEVLYQVSRTDGEELTSDDLNSTYDVLKRNVDSLGVSEPEITIEGSDKIRVKLAGVTDVESAREVLSNVANISFRDVDDNLLMDSSVISGAKLSYDESGNPAIALEVADKATFLEVTTELSERDDGENLMVIWYNFEEGVNSYEDEESTCGQEDSMCLSAASVSQGFSSDVIITGSFDKEEAETLASSINAGSISTKLTELSSQTVSAQYGTNVLLKTFIAGVIGMVVVILFMSILYKFSGFIQGIMLLIYMLLVMGVYWLIGGVLSLSAIAALVLGIGMAVDSCVITNERIKESLEDNKSLSLAFKYGNSESWTSIFDANVTTFIVAIVLFVFGESSVKGFATMLIITIFATMFVMVYLNRIILKMFVKTKYFNDRPNSFVKYLKKNKPRRKIRINATKMLKKCHIVTCVYLVFGALFLIFNGLNLGIDFRSGSDVSISADNISVNKIKKDFEELELDVLSIEENDDNEIYVKLNIELQEDEINTVNNYFADKYDAICEINVVTNLAKQNLIKNAILSVIIAMIVMIIYISIRFKFSYAISSIIALVHDVVVVTILFSIFNIEVNVIFIAAILTIIGYSINNTIVVFDRIRQNLKKYNSKFTIDNLKEVVNDSVSQTFTRSIYTTITTMIPVICLVVLGTSGILSFNLALLFGLVAGCYSSAILASQLWYVIESRKLKNKDKNKVTKTFKSSKKNKNNKKNSKKR